MPADTVEDCRVPRTPPGRVFNRVIVGLVAAGVCTVVVPALDLWALWFQGRSVAAQPFWWDVPVVIWGRVGKVLQFTAGLAVLIDLLDPDKLRARGRLATERLTKRRTHLRTRMRPYRLYALERSLYDSLVDERPLPYGTEPARSVNTAPPRDFGADVPFTIDDYLAFREQVMADLPDPDRWLSDAEIRAISEQIRVFLDEHLSPDDKAAFQQAEEKWGRTFAVAGIALVAGLVYSQAIDTSLTAMYLYAVLTVAFLTVLSPAGAYIAALPGLVRETPALTAGYLARRLLDKTRPLHAFRKVAVVLFIIGFSLDLLAS